MKNNKPKNPIQPLYETDSGVIRYKENAIVDYILEKGGIDLNHIAQQDFSQDDREQFAQLIGYSWSGACDLSYFSDVTADAALKAFEDGLDEKDSKIKAFEEENEALKDTLEKIQELTSEFGSVW